MDKVCECYHVVEAGTWLERSECWGTKERDVCSCGGDEAHCTFYPEKARAADPKHKCPFRKRTHYECGQNSGSGYPISWVATEEFEDCIGEECQVFVQERYDTRCGMCR